MGFVYANVGTWIHAYPEKEALFSDALLTPGQDDNTVTVEALTAGEVNKLALKLDILANEKQNMAISAAVAKAFPTILQLVAWVKDKTNQKFEGMRGVGSQLDILWLRPEDVGGTLVDKDQGSNKHLWAGASAVHTWLHSYTTAGTAESVIPLQSMLREAGLIHIGVVQRVAGEAPETRIEFTLSGIAGPAQSLSFSQTNGSELRFQEWEVPVVVGPEREQKVDVDPCAVQETRFELLSLLVARAKDLTI